jgi:nitroreductase
LEFEEVVNGRRSIRGYKPDPVPREVIEEVVALATRVPSSMNTQPWHLYVVTGEPLDQIRKQNTRRNPAGVKPSRVTGLVQAAWSKGLGAVVNSQGIMQSPVVREHAGIPDDQVIMICVAMGYPDDDFAANHVVSRRRLVAEVASFVGFAPEADVRSAC